MAIETEFVSQVLSLLLTTVLISGIALVVGWAFKWNGWVLACVVDVFFLTFESAKNYLLQERELFAVCLGYLFIFAVAAFLSIGAQRHAFLTQYFSRKETEEKADETLPKL